ncbi:MAG TPA: response regulator [Flavobacteriales bacterium]|nr:response regulator [Flavobacteriales bacterium]
MSSTSATHGPHRPHPDEAQRTPHREDPPQERSSGTPTASGTMFGTEVAATVNIPAAKGPMEAAMGMHHLTEPLNGARPMIGPQRIPRRVLVVDDNPDIVLSMSLLLTRLGHVVSTANNGREAVEQAAGFRPEVVLMDIGMPEMNGYDAARRLRLQPWGQTMLLVAITGWGQEQDVQMAIEAGFDRHLVKPVDRETIIGLLATPPRSAA